VDNDAAPRSLTVRANELDHHVLEWPANPGAGTASAFLLHGYMDAAGTWDLVAPLLARAGLRVLAPDARGFGDGPRAPSGSYYHFTDYVADLADLIDALTPKGASVFLVGHSMGGTISSLYAGAFPERVTKLALLEGLGALHNPPEVLPDRMRRWIEEVRSVHARGIDAKTVGTREHAQRRLVMNHPHVPPAVLAHRLPHLVRDAGVGQVAWRYDPLHRTTSPTGFSAPAYTEFLRRLTCQVLFVDGGIHGYHPPDEAERLAAIRHLERAALEGAGHMMHWTRPGELAELLVRFWGA
jgi:pimeloyl-ACP methyl ester carboxylesterase